MAENASTLTKVVFGEVRFSYVHIFKPHAIDGGDEKYSISILIPKKEKKMIAKVNAAIEAAVEVAKKQMGGKLPKNFKLPMRDGDIEREDDDAYQGCFYLNANSRTKPDIVDKRGNPIIDQEEVYSGCYGYISVTFFPFDKNGNRGIACGLNNVMKSKDGESLGGRVSAEVDFAGIVIDNDDDDDEDFMK